MLTGLQVLNEIEDRIGWAQSASIEGTVRKETRKLVRLLNRVLQNLGTLESWPMLHGDGTILTQAGVQYSMLLDLTNGSETVTISSYDSSGFTFEQKHKGWAIQLGTSDTPIYRVASVTSPTVVVLNRVWIGDTQTITSADDDTLAMTLAMDQYTLPEDFDRPTGKWEDFLSSYGLSPETPEGFAKLRRSEGRTITLGAPRVYTIYGLDPSEAYQVLHLHPWPEDQTLLQYGFQKMHPLIERDDDRVYFQQSQLGVVIEAVIYLSNRDYEDDQRMQAALMEYLQQFKTIKGQNVQTVDTKSLSPWRGNRIRSIRAMRRSGVRYDYGDFFDRAGSVNLP